MLEADIFTFYTNDSHGEFSSDLYRALVCDIIIRKCIIRILYFSGLFLSTSMTLNDIK